jgi:hypothetical protein
MKRPARRTSSGAWRPSFPSSVAEKDHARLMTFYARGRKEKNFEAGITKALEAILASPQFLFRVEDTPAACHHCGLSAGDYELASRLSFFLWGRGPDAELMKAAAQGRLALPGALAKQSRRMLTSPHGRCSRDTIRVAMAAAAGSREGHSRPDPLSVLRPNAVAGAEERDRAVLRQSRAGGSQPARSADR